MHVEPAFNTLHQAPSPAEKKRNRSLKDHTDLKAQEEEKSTKRVNVDAYSVSSCDNKEDSFQKNLGPTPVKVQAIGLKLGECIKKGSLEGVQACIRQGARLDQPISPDGMFPLNAALTMNSEASIPLAKIMIAELPECVNFSCEETVSPLLTAYTTHNMDLIKFLLNNGADPFSSPVKHSYSFYEFLTDMADLGGLPRHGREAFKIVQQWEKNKNLTLHM